MSAHSGIDIQFDKEANYRGTKEDGSADYADGFYEASKNRIVINPEGKRTAERLLIHELDHAIRKYIDGEGKQATRIYFEAIEGVDQATRDNILKEYKKTAEPGKVDAVVMDEMNAYYAEQVLGNKYTLEKLLEAEPTLKDKILSFFKGASTDYADVPKLSNAAKKYYRTYKKLFDEFSARNAENNALENAHLGSNFEKNAQKMSITGANSENMQVSDKSYMLPDGLTDVDPTSITEEEVKTLLERSAKKQYRDSTYLPVRINTPQILIDVAASRGAKIENLPVVMQVEKIRQSMATEEEWRAENKTSRAHDLSSDEVISIIKAMDQPKYIVYQTDNERYVEIVKYKSSKSTEGIAVIEIGEEKNPAALNGYKGGKYQILITAFNPDDGFIDSILNKTSNRVLYPKKKKGSSQRGPGNKVPSHLNDSPFAISISQPEQKSNSFDKKTSDRQDARQYAVGLDEDNNGRKLTSEQSKYFKNSTVRDAEGRLLTLYHGTDAEFTTFEKGHKRTRGRLNLGEGFYFATTRSYAGNYSNGRIVEAYVNLTNPYRVIGNQFTEWEMDDIRSKLSAEDKSKLNYDNVSDYLVKLGYDGVLGLNYSGTKTTINSVVAFKSNQIKNVSNQTPTVNPDINYALDIDSDSKNISGAEVMGWLNNKPEGDEFTSPTISTVGKERVTYQEKFGSKEWRKTKTESAYIHAVDEMYGIQSYLEKVGKVKNAKAIIQNVRSTPHQAQSMIGSVQYNVFEADKKSAKKIGEGLNEIFRPIEKMGDKAAIDFDDYLLNYLNVDKYQVIERTQRHDKDAAESLSKVREETSNHEDQRSKLENRIFNLGNSPAEVRIKEGLKKSIEKIDNEIIKSRSDEIALLSEAPGYAEAELKKVRNEVAELLGEKERAKADYTTDKVFSQASVKRGFDSIEAVKKLPAGVREDIARKLWIELEMSDSDDVRDTFALKY